MPAILASAYGRLVGSSGRAQVVYDLIRRVADLSASVLIGFLTGVAANIVFGQLQDLTGTSPGSGVAVVRAARVLTRPGQWHLPSLLVGLGALGINYPNAWDRSQGRSGRGLFVHGVPANTLARLPYATDGCVALANDDLLELAAATAPGQTPVLITQQLNWVEPQAAAQAATSFRAAYDSWDQARQAGDQAQASRWHDPLAQIDAAVARWCARRSRWPTCSSRTPRRGRTSRTPPSSTASRRPSAT